MHLFSRYVFLIFAALVPLCVDAVHRIGATSLRPGNNPLQHLGSIKLYWLEISRSQRILWLLEELEVPYELIAFNRVSRTMAADPELRKVHALGKFPVVSIKPRGSAPAIILAESAFIVEYLIEYFGHNRRLAPDRFLLGIKKIGQETEEWMRYQYFMHYAEGSLMPLLTIGGISQQIQKLSVEPIYKPIINKIPNKIFTNYLGPNLQTHFKFLEEQLQTSPKHGSYLCGPYLTGADIMMSFPLIAAKNVDLADLTHKNYPYLRAYVERLEKNTGYKRSLAIIDDMYAHVGKRRKTAEN